VWLNHPCLTSWTWQDQTFHFSTNVHDSTISSCEAFWARWHKDQLFNVNSVGFNALSFFAADIFQLPRLVGPQKWNSQFTKCRTSCSNLQSSNSRDCSFEFGNRIKRRKSRYRYLQNTCCYLCHCCHSRYPQCPIRRSLIFLPCEYPVYKRASLWPRTSCVNRVSRESQVFEWAYGLSFVQ